MLITKTRVESVGLNLTYTAAKAIALSHVTGVQMCIDDGHPLTPEQEAAILTARLITFEGVLSGVHDEVQAFETIRWDSDDAAE